MAWREDVERNAKTVLGLAAGELVNASPSSEQGGRRPPGGRLESTGRDGAIGPRLCACLHRRRFQGHRRFTAGRLPRRPVAASLVQGGQPLFMFGERAGIMDVRLDGEDWFATVNLTNSRKARPQ